MNEVKEAVEGKGGINKKPESPPPRFAPAGQGERACQRNNIEIHRFFRVVNKPAGITVEADTRDGKNLIRIMHTGTPSVDGVELFFTPDGRFCGSGMMPINGHKTRAA